MTQERSVAGTGARFSLTVDCDEREAIVQVIDEGATIPNEVLARAFEAAVSQRFPARVYTVRVPLAAPRSRRRILVVDDNVDAAQSLGLVLRALGHDVQVAHDGHAALEAARMNRPHLVLLDLSMPGIDGFGVVRVLRKEPHFAHVPMIAVTAAAEPEDRRRSREAGFAAHLVKPVALETIRRLLAQL